MVEVLGYILVAVNLTSAGEVEGTAINYYKSNVECYYDAVELEQEANPGVGFVCLEDFVIIE
tara:strand:+ start:30 stop:215 length:186 start_codon:yes stop_codon:yes gene_type:complete